MTPTNRLPRKIQLLLIGVVLVVGLVAVFWKKIVYPPPPAPITLTIAGEDSSNLHAIETLLDGYRAKTGTQVRVVKLAFGDLQTQAAQDLQSGAKRFDIILNYNFSLASYVRRNWVFGLRELKGLLGNEALVPTYETDIIEPAWREIGYYRRGSGPTAKEEPIGYPFAANTMLLAYNRRLFESPEHRQRYRQRYNEDLVPPRDWAQFRRVAEYFSERPPLKGLSLQGGTDGWLYYEWTNFAFSMGGGVMRKKYGWDSDEHTPLILTDPATIKATEFYMSLKPFTTDSFFGNGAVEQREELRRGVAAMAIMWSDYAYDLIYDGGTPHVDDFGFAPIPGNVSMLAGGVYYVSKRSSNPEAAASFINYLMERPQQIALAQRGLASPLRSVYSDPEVAKIPYATALRASLERGIYMNEAAPDSILIAEALTQQLQRIWRGEVSASIGLAEAAQQIRDRRVAAFKTQ
jgi:multiple sugar transport system substrate-binding protein